MKSLINAFIDNKVAANLLAAFFVVVGISAGSQLIVRLFPDAELYSVSITVPYPGAAPEEVEEGIVEPIEEQLEGLEGVRTIRAVAADGLANVIVELHDGSDTSELVNDVRTEVGQITVFPEQAEEPQISDLESDEIVAQVVVSGDVDPVLLKKQAQRIRQQLAATDAISRAELAGIADYLIEIAVPSARLRSYGLSLPQLADIVAAQSLELSAGEIEGEQRRTLVRTMGESEIGEEFAQIVVTTSQSGTPVTLGDIADIHDALDESPLQARYEGKPAVVINVFRVGDENVFDIKRAVTGVLDGLDDALSGGVQATLWDDQSDGLQSRIDLLVRNAVIGFALVMLLLLLFLDIRIAFWVAVGVIISFVGAMIPMGLVGIAISQLSLFGFILAIGIVVDDAIVVGENIYSTIERHEAHGVEAARRGTLRVSAPVLFSVSTTIAAFLPLIFLPGVFGQFLGAVAAVVIFVLILSLIESFLILPRHLSHLSERPPRRWSPRRFADPLRDRVSHVLDRFSERRLRPAIGFSVARPLVTMMFAVAALILTFGLFASGVIKFEFFPEVEGNYVTAQLELAEATSEVQTRRAAERLAETARQAAQHIADGLDVSADEVLTGTLWTLGVNLGSDGPVNAGTSAGAASNQAYVTVRIQDAAARSFTAADFERAWREATGDIPGAQSLTFNADLTGSGAAVTVQLAAEDEQRARAAVAELHRRIEAIPGTQSVRDDRFRTTDEVQIRLLPQARALGLTLQDVASQVRAAYFGAEAVRVQRDREEIEVRLRLPASERASLATIEQQRILVGDSWVPISQVAELSIGDAPSVINRKNGRRIYTIESDVDPEVTTGSNVSARVFGEVWPEVQQQFPDVTLEPGGEQEEQQRAQAALKRNFSIALFAIYALLALAFGSYTQPLVVMSIIPFGLIGALVGHALLGLDLTLLSLFGIIGLSGVIINDALLMVDYINEGIDQGKPPGQAITDAAVSRFRPILLTSLTTFLGVTPIILEQSVQAAFLVPTAVSLGFGILFGTLLLMLVVPAAASLHQRAHAGARRLAGKVSDAAGGAGEAHGESR